jgi:hypothetical protein
MIDGKKFEYEDIDLNNFCNVAMNSNLAKELLIKTKNVFDAYKIDFCLIFGTLLGAVRDKNFIQGDEDIDIYINSKNEMRLLSIIPALYDNDIKLCRARERAIYSFMYMDKCYIDVYILQNFKFNVFGIYCYKIDGCAIPKKYFLETQEIEFLDTIFNCPKEPEKLLEFMYGKTWNIPIRGHNFRYEVYPAYLYRQLKSIIKFLINYKWLKEKIYNAHKNNFSK